MPLFDRGLKLLLRYIAAFEHDLTVDLNGGELGQGRPLKQAEGRLLDDLDVERILLLQLRDHGTDIVSPLPLRIVEVKPDQHVEDPHCNKDIFNSLANPEASCGECARSWIQPPRSLRIAMWGIVTSVKTSDTAV